MPKKLGVNTKSVEAKARKDAEKKEKDEKAKKQKEDELWRDDDKHINRKLERKNDAEKKKAEALQRKLENKAAYEDELGSLESKKAAAKPTKVTRSQIETRLQQQQQEQEQKRKTEEKTHLDAEITENVNKLTIEGEVARSIDDAIVVLNKEEEALDRHPERRVKAAYAAYEEYHLQRLKTENPNLRLSQLKQILKKDWLKSPENPLNQRSLAYNSKA